MGSSRSDPALLPASSGRGPPTTRVKCIGSFTRWRRPVVAARIATGRPACRTLTRPPATTTCTVSPISRQGTE